MVFQNMLFTLFCMTSYTQLERSGSYIWIFTRYGFFSASVKQKGSNIINLRARSRKHLEQLIQRFKNDLKSLRDIKIIELPHTDYRYRIELQKRSWIALLVHIAEEQDWSNFKNESHNWADAHGGDSDYISSLHSVWGVMHRIQTKQQARKVQRELEWEVDRLFPPGFDEDLDAPSDEEAAKQEPVKSLLDKVVATSSTCSCPAFRIDLRCPVHGGRSSLMRDVIDYAEQVEKDPFRAPSLRPDDPKFPDFGRFKKLLPDPQKKKSE
jgi:hypothetical protein